MTIKEISELLNYNKSKIIELKNSNKIKKISRNNYDKKSVIEYKNEMDFRLKNKANWKY